MPNRKPPSAAGFVDAVLDEQRRVFAKLSQAGFERFCRAIDDAGRVFLYGVGRNGLMLQAFAMRLGHLGIEGRQHLRIAVGEAHLEPAFAQLLGDLEADEAAPDNGGAADAGALTAPDAAPTS